MDREKIAFATMKPLGVALGAAVKSIAGEGE